jgi:hypothetical protein
MLEDRHPVHTFPSNVFTLDGSVSVYLSYITGTSPNVRELLATIQTDAGIVHTNRLSVSLDEFTVVIDVLERLLKSV